MDSVKTRPNLISTVVANLLPKGFTILARGDVKDVDGDIHEDALIVGWSDPFGFRKAFFDRETGMYISEF
jgi:hypothetical protein